MRTSIPKIEQCYLFFDKLIGWYVGKEKNLYIYLKTWNMEISSKKMLIYHREGEKVTVWLFIMVVFLIIIQNYHKITPKKG